MKLTLKEKQARTRVIVMGLSGAGKSTLVSKLAEEGFNLHWLTIDNDADILFKLSPEAKERVEIYDIPDTASFPVAADTLMKLFKDKKGTICHTHGVWNCSKCKMSGAESSPIDLTALGENDIVVIDTGTSLGHSIMAHATRHQGVEYKPERDDWGALRKWTEFFYSEWQGAKFNLVVICHTVEATMEDDKLKLVPSFGSKDMSGKIAGAFSHVVYCEVKNKKHMAYSGSTYANNILTKSRTDFLIESLKEPSLAPIFKGKVPETVKEEPSASQGTPAQKAATDLSALREKLKGAAK